VETNPESLEALRGRVGVWTGSHERVSASQSGEIAAELESLGYAAMWIPESRGREAFTNAHLLLSDTSQMIIATGIANIYGRDAFNSASVAKTLNAAFGGRFILGLGVSHPPTVTDLRGHLYDSPYRTMGKYLAAMDAAVMCAPEAEQRYARVLAALGPKMLALAASSTDGVHTYKVTPEHTAMARSVLGSKFIAVEQAIVLTRDRREFFERAREHLSNTLKLENYVNSWRRLGFTEEDFSGGGSNRLCEALVAYGDDAAILSRIDEHLAAGADHVCVQVLGGDLNVPPMVEWRALAPALVAPR
jgi:probable F420-dependent oxidoreductase